MKSWCEPTVAYAKQRTFSQERGLLQEKLLALENFFFRKMDQFHWQHAHFSGEKLIKEPRSLDSLWVSLPRGMSFLDKPKGLIVCMGHSSDPELNLLH
jgi:hypothetical protein